MKYIFLMIAEAILELFQWANFSICIKTTLTNILILCSDKG